MSRTLGRRIAVVFGVLATVAVVVGVTVAIASTDITRPTTVTVIEHPTTDTVVDIGAPGDSTGDVLTFHNRVYDRTDTHVVGRDQGECIRISPAAGTWECTWVTILRGGQITVEGQYRDTADTILAVTGGTGMYANVRGDMALKAINGGTEYAFVFRLIP